MRLPLTMSDEFIVFSGVWDLYSMIERDMITHKRLRCIYFILGTLKFIIKYIDLKKFENIVPVSSYWNSKEKKSYSS